MNTAALAQLDKASVELEALRSILLVGEPSTPPAPPISPEPGPLRTIILPRENNSALNAFYGKANRSGSILDWFNFPLKNMRLYSRNGANMSDHDGDGFDDHRCHKKIKTRLAAAYVEIFQTLGVERFMREGWHVYSGCFNFRTKRGGSSLSTHAWGIAVDVNDSENPFLSSKTTFSETAIDIMEKHGFLSGGRAWGKDWMHFQAAIPHISSGSYYAKNGLPKHIVAA